jgi:nicotinate dehydrogenase subunit A
MISLNVNGEDRQIDAPPDAPLLFVLRNDLGLTAPQFGCGEEACGACKVLLDREPVMTCRLPLAAAAGRRVVTLEGLEPDGDLHPVQQAFIEEQATQCGICANGMIIEAAALVMRNNPTDERIREAMAGNLCRCGSHNRIVKAVRRAADMLWS